MEHNILFVDDEKNILVAMKRIFHASPFTLFFADSGEEALTLLKEQTMSVIISDMKMPGMNGIDFLRASEEYSPHAIRIILSGYSDINDILRAVNEGHVHNYITKPWENERLKIILYNAIISYENNIQIRNMAEELKDKNSQLESINNSLEETIKQRNKELTLRNSVLVSLLNDPDTGKNLTRCIDAVRELLEENRVYLHLSEENEIPGLLNRDEKPSEQIIRVLKNIDKTVYVNNHLILPLKIKNKTACYIIVYPVTDRMRSMIPEVVSLSNMVKLVMQQYINLQESRDLMESIDDLLEDF